MWGYRLLTRAFVVLGTVLAVLVSGAQAATPDPIVGLWKGAAPFRGDPIQVQGPGRDSMFFGLTMGANSTFFSACPHPRGEVIWAIKALGGGHCSGTHAGFAHSSINCTDRVSLETTWTVSGNRMQVALAAMGSTVGACGSGGTTCYTFVRASSPSAPAAKDTSSPILTALPSTGKRGTTIRLRYRVSDNSGVTREAVAIYRGKTLLKRSILEYGEAKGKVYFASYRPPASFAGSYRFCGQSQDRAADLSKISCASLKIA